MVGRAPRTLKLDDDNRMPRPQVSNAIRRRLLLSMSASVSLGLLMTAVVFLVGATTIRTLADRTSTMNAVERAAHALEISLHTQETLVFDFALSRRPEALEAFDAATNTSVEAYSSLQALARDEPTLLAAAQLAYQTGHEWREEWAEPFLRAVEGGSALSGTTTVASSGELFRPAETALEALKDELDRQRANAATIVEAAIPTLATVIISIGIATTILLAMLGFWLTRSISGPLRRLNQTTEALVAGQPVTFRPEHNDEIGALAEALERLRIDAATRYGEARREGEHAATFNQLAELTSFASSEVELVEAATRAVRRLVPTTAGDILLANPSQNRLTVGVAWGDDAPAAGSVVPLGRIDSCPGIRRSSAFVVGDSADDMAVHCPAHPRTAGSIACVPMMALGKIVGVIHLEAAAPQAFAPAAIGLVTRVAETVGLAMANARLMKTMEGQAMSDALTGLANARFFDPYLEQELEATRRDQEPLSLVMIDIDHFKDFNDTYGHPAGDEALRSFARVLGSSIRASDVAARYGGEEFIIALRHAGAEEAVVLAEKVRLAVEQMVIELGPGRYARITASFGVASTELHVTDQKALVSLADAALYRAKEAGRNRVEMAPTGKDLVTLDAARKRRHGRATATGETSDQAR
jgi:diguanylate cyclase (GGDEF)-like protein